MDNRVYHTGLWSNDNKEIKKFVERVNSFNMKNLGNPIMLDLMIYEEGEDKERPEPHTKFRLLFPDRPTMARFWRGNE